MRTTTAGVHRLVAACLIGLSASAAASAQEPKCKFEGSSSKEQQIYCAGFRAGVAAAGGGTTGSVPLTIVPQQLSGTPSGTTGMQTQDLTPIYVPANWKDRLKAGSNDWAVLSKSDPTKIRSIVPGKELLPKESGWAITETKPLLEGLSKDEQTKLQAELENVLKNAPESAAGYTVLMPALQKSNN